MPGLIDKTASYLVSRSKFQYSKRELWAAVVFGSLLEIVIIPGILVISGRALDQAVGLAFPISEMLTQALAAVCFLCGVPWLAWSIFWQHYRGRGTPLPLVPTKDLLTDGPYQYMRNPMAFGAILWLAGWGFLFSTVIGLIGGVGFFAFSVLGWDLFVEEQELLEKHGEKYRLYRSRTPFILPRIRPSK